MELQFSGAGGRVQDVLIKAWQRTKQGIKETFCPEVCHICLGAVCSYCVLHCRLKEFSDVLGAEEINLQKLKELCFHGKLSFISFPD